MKKSLINYLIPLIILGFILISNLFMKLEFISNHFNPKPITTLIKDQSNLAEPLKEHLETNNDEFDHEGHKIKANAFHPFPPSSIKSLIKKKNWPEALQALDSLKPVELASLWRSYIFQQQQKWPQALVQVNQSLQAPTDRGYYFKARWFHQQNISADSVIFYSKKALEFNPKNSQVGMLLGLSFSKSNQLDSAIYYLTKASKSNRGKSGVEIQLELAKLFMKSKDYSTADSILKIAIRRDPQNHRTRIERANISIQTRDMESAKKQLLKTLKIIPENTKDFTQVLGLLSQVGFCKDIERLIHPKSSYRHINTLLNCWSHSGQHKQIYTFTHDKHLKQIKEWKNAHSIQTKYLPWLKTLTSPMDSTLSPWTLLLYDAEINSVLPSSSDLYQIESQMGEDWKWSLLIDWWIKAKNLPKAQQLLDNWSGDSLSQPQKLHLQAKILNAESKPKLGFQKYLNVLSHYPNWLPSRFNAQLLISNTEDSVWAITAQEQLDSIKFQLDESAWPLLKLRIALLKPQNLTDEDLIQKQQYILNLKANQKKLNSLLYPIYIDLARLLMNKGYAQNSLELYQLTPKGKLKNVDISNVIKAYYVLKKWNPAIAFIQENQLEKSNSEQILRELSQFYFTYNKIEKAIEVLENYLNSSEDFKAPISYELALLYEADSDYTMALKHLKPAVTASPNNTDWRIKLAQLFLKNKQLKEAEAEKSKLLKLNLSDQQVLKLQNIFTP